MNHLEKRAITEVHKKKQHKFSMTEKQLDIVGHSLGINIYHAIHSKKKKDKKLPKEFYRNYYCAGTERHHNFSTLLELEVLGLMERWTHDDMIFFGVTKAGTRVFIDEFLEKCK